MRASFGNILADLRKTAGKMTQQQLAEQLGVERGAVANYESKGKMPHVDTLIKIADLFNVSLDYLIGRSVANQSQDMALSADANLRILPIVVDKDEKERITLVPLRAAAGYLSRYQEVEYIKDLPSFNLPNFTDGTYRAFEVEGDSMKPTISPRDIVVCKYVDNWHHVRDNQVYTVLGASGVGIVVKRVLNRIKSDNRILLRSDNDFYPEFDLEVGDIHEIWEVKATISTNLEPPYYLENRFRELKDNMNGMLNLITKTIGNQ